MKINFVKYRNSIRNARAKRPKAALASILFEKGIKKSRQLYNSLRFKLLRDSTFLDEDSLYMCSLFPAKVIDFVLREFHPQSILDIGCGTGVSLQYFLGKNVDAVGVENSKLAISKSPVRGKIIRHNLKKALNLKRKFDLVWSFEVIEHIHPKYEFVFLNTLVRHSDRIVISAAIPQQGGHGHFNEQTPEYWIDRFVNLGFQLNQEVTERLRNIDEMHAENLLVFERRRLPE